ncbi:MAG: sulfatase/phosphatase domain-containing protein, partial [Planctomycetota bacterium]
YDKRWMFEESLAMPFVIRWPGSIEPGSRPEELIQNIDYAPTFLEMAGLPVPDEVQGHSVVPVLTEDPDLQWRSSIYYAYYEVGEHNVPQHFGVRTRTHKLMYFPATDEWNMFDLVSDPEEMTSIYDEARYAGIKEELTAELHRLQEHYEAPVIE